MGKETDEIVLGILYAKAGWTPEALNQQKPRQAFHWVKSP